MSNRKDLTRWNRASLTLFKYVDGNAVEYLEILRQQLVKRFVDPKVAKSKWLKPAEEVPANEARKENETLIQRQERLSRKQKRILESYHQDRAQAGFISLDGLEVALCNNDAGNPSSGYYRLKLHGGRKG